jgi:hypothetical protein
MLCNILEMFLGVPVPKCEHGVTVQLHLSQSKITYCM